MSAQDHKRVFDDDHGPNTGGMGAFAPEPADGSGPRGARDADHRRAGRRGLRDEGHPYSRVSLRRAHAHPDGPKVIEFNVRFGDPEAQVVIPMIAEDLAPRLAAAADGALDPAPIASARAPRRRGRSRRRVIRLRSRRARPSRGSPQLPRSTTCWSSMPGRPLEPGEHGRGGRAGADDRGTRHDIHRRHRARLRGRLADRFRRHALSNGHRTKGATCLTSRLDPHGLRFGCPHHAGRGGPASRARDPLRDDRRVGASLAGARDAPGRGGPGRGVKVFIVGAGAAAHLAGVVAAHTTLPVIGVPIDSSALKGLDALLSTVQMPPGVPVATVSIGKPGATNAAVLAAQILALGDEAVRGRLVQYKAGLADKVEAAAKRLRRVILRSRAVRDRHLRLPGEPGGLAAARGAVAGARRPRRRPSPRRTWWSSIPARSPPRPIRARGRPSAGSPARTRRRGRRHGLLRDAAARRGGRAAERPAHRPQRRQARRPRPAGGGGRADHRRAVRGRRWRLRSADRRRAWRADRLHAARPDRLRRALQLLHHPVDPRPQPQPAPGGCAGRGPADRGRRLQGDRAHRRPSGFVRPRPAAALVARAPPGGSGGTRRRCHLSHQLARADGLYAGHRGPRRVERRPVRAALPPAAAARRATGCWRGCGARTP
jgi:phosphoribosylaminoimidazole carboxylase PurE protein